jgi:hypothetical protein
MRTRHGRTFQQIVESFAPIGARMVLDKARLASTVAKCAVNFRSMRSAYRAKERCLKQAVRIFEGRIHCRRDSKARRWRLRFEGWGEIHGDPT